MVEVEFLLLHRGPGRVNSSDTRMQNSVRGRADLRVAVAGVAARSQATKKNNKWPN